MAGRNTRSRSMVRALKAPDLYPLRRQTEELRRAVEDVEAFGRGAGAFDPDAYLASLDAQVDAVGA